MIKKLKSIDLILTRLMYQLACMTHRYDERMSMIISEEFIDRF